MNYLNPWFNCCLVLFNEIFNAYMVSMAKDKYTTRSAIDLPKLHNRARVELKAVMTEGVVII